MENNDFTYEFVQSVYNDMGRFLQSSATSYKQTDLTNQVTGDKYPHFHQLIQNIRNSGQQSKQATLVTSEINPEVIKKSSTLTQKQGAYWYLTLTKPQECCLTLAERRQVYNALQVTHPASGEQICKYIVRGISPSANMNMLDPHSFFWILFDQIRNNNIQYQPIEFIKEFQSIGLNEICKLLEKALLGYNPP